MTSTSSLGNTSIVLQFDLNRNIDGAALDVQSAISSAMRRLPAELPTPPSFRKVNPADYADHVPGAEVHARCGCPTSTPSPTARSCRALDPAGRRPGADLRQPEIRRARARRPRPARGARPDAARAADRHRQRQLEQAGRRDRRPAPELDPRRHRPDQQGGRLHAGDRDLAERRAGARRRRRHRRSTASRTTRSRAGSTARAPSCSPSSASPTPTPSRSSTGSRRCCRRSRPSCRPASTSRC